MTVWGELPTVKAEQILHEHGSSSDGFNNYDNIAHGEAEDKLTCVHEYYRPGRAGIVSVRNEIDHWGTLPELPQKLSGLKDLVWASRALLPPWLLQELQANPACRLHNLLFRLPSLQIKGDLGDVPGIDPHEFALATWPNLTRIMMSDSGSHVPGQVDWNKDAILFRILKPTPSLKHVHIARQYLQFRPVTRQMRQLARSSRRWPGVSIYNGRQALQHQELTFQGPRPHLRTLSFRPANYWFDACTWLGRILCSKLETLHLWEVSHDVLSVAARCEFSSLTAVALDPHEDYMEDTEGVWDQTVATLIASINGKLTSIHLSTGVVGNVETKRSLQAVLDTHGQTLEKLSLVGGIYIDPRAPPTTVAQIEQISTACPRLRELRLPVRRQRGSIQEAAMYKALGTYLPRLETLWLRLDSITEAENKIDEQATQDLLADIAVDETLARSIMATVLDAAQPRSALRLLQIEHGRNAGVPQGLSEILDRMEFRWKCFRFFDHGVERVIVQRVKARNRGYGFKKGFVELGSYKGVF
ncbi:uncharacterized protein DSM5745_07949 [Aspergillus mulundensis]|uniref:Uncharacterized protein n=1 Tax=Aspergillus mulundensis TaxID=1810919 RepID=A0A3D8RFF8_9EURO|nr:hypothetical protein DSM5745_07949 [Aspergillus mulundensis]RDW72777.1 hypothetical protein DSM5745_07949 [Aspergillus mulundensis]